MAEVAVKLAEDLLLLAVEHNVEHQNSEVMTEILELLLYVVQPFLVHAVAYVIG